MFTISLINPQIPPNTGNIGRLCAATNSKLELVGELGFDISDKALKRAGLDYWHLVNWSHIPNLDRFLDQLNPKHCFFLSSKVSKHYTNCTFKKGDRLIFGSETSGLGAPLLERFKDRCVTIPMLNRSKGMRSLNLANSVSIVLFEALRQNRAFTHPH